MTMCAHYSEIAVRHIHFACPLCQMKAKTKREIIKHIVNDHDDGDAMGAGFM